jgi:hypothetical protein
MAKRNRIVYSINVEDLQTVAEEELERELTAEEIKLVEDRLGEYIDWYGTIAMVLDEVINRHREEDSDEAI